MHNRQIAELTSEVIQLKMLNFQIDNDQFNDSYNGSTSSYNGSSSNDSSTDGSTSGKKPNVILNAPGLQLNTTICVDQFIADGNADVTENEKGTTYEIDTKKTSVLGAEIYLSLEKLVDGNQNCYHAYFCVEKMTMSN